MLANYGSFLVSFLRKMPAAWRQGLLIAFAVVALVAVGGDWLELWALPEKVYQLLNIVGAYLGFQSAANVTKPNIDWFDPADYEADDTEIQEA